MANEKHFPNRTSKSVAMAPLQNYRVLLLFATFHRVNSNFKEVSYFSWQNKNFQTWRLLVTSSQKLPRELIPSETSHICRCGFKMRNVYYFSKIPGIVQRCFINTWSQKFQKMFKEALMKEWLFKWIWSSLACKFVEKRALVKGLCTPLNHEIFQNKLI